MTRKTATGFTDDLPEIVDELPPMVRPAQVDFDTLIAHAMPASMILGAGDTLEKDKDDLVNIEFIITEYTFRYGDSSPEYVSIKCMTRDGVTRVFNDGSSGIYGELRTADPNLPLDEPRSVVIHVPQGLRVSKYRVCDEHRKPCKTKPRDDGTPGEWCRVGEHFATRTTPGATYYFNR